MLKRLFAIVLITVSLGFGAETQKGIEAYQANDYSTALVVFIENAKSGDTVAQSYLGWMYRNGYGVDKNFNEALKYFLSAAKLGENKAIKQLASMYSKGEGVKRNYIIAYALGELLVQKGDVEDGQRYQGIIMHLMYENEIKEAEQLAKTPNKLWNTIQLEIK